jgi:hypothetical protein
MLFNRRMDKENVGYLHNGVLLTKPTQSVNRFSSTGKTKRKKKGGED